MNIYGPHLAPGVEHGGTLPKDFVVASEDHGVYRTRGMAEIIPGSFPVPQNPIMSVLSGSRPTPGGDKVGVGDCGCGCGGSGGCGGSLNGMGDLTTDWNKFSTDLSAGSFGTALQDTVYGFPIWGVLGILAFLMLADTGGGSVYARGRRASRAAAKAY